MNPAHVGPAKSIRNATGEGCSGSFFGVPMGEESRVLLRSALRSTASPQTALRRTLDPSPSKRVLRSRTLPARAWGGVGG